MSKDETVMIVSGLPRSGTSMMMKMLEAGGVPVLVDNIREADEDNPKGYYEFERVKKLPEDTEWLPDAVGKVVKMVFVLLKELPEGYHYKVVFMRRAIEEIVASQNQMLERNNKANTVDDLEIVRSFEMLLDSIKKWIADQPHIEFQEFWYGDVLEDPATTAQQASSFLGMDLDLDAMAAVVDESLYRNRAEEASK